MSIPILVALAVGEPDPDAPPGRPGPVPLADALEVAATAQAAGVAALWLLDAVGNRPAIDPSVVGAYLAGRYDELGYVVDVPTTHQAPYNTARRIQSFDRATAGRVGAALRPGAGDEVSDAATGAATDAPAAQRWAEYAGILIASWDSFPRAALVGDQESAIVVDDALLRPIGHVGPSYRVAGPLDGPSSEQGRPVLVAADVDVVGWPGVAVTADAVVVGREESRGADAALVGALAAAGRRRADVALLGRAVVDADAQRADVLAEELLGWLDRDRLDGLVLVPSGGTRGVLSALRALVPLLSGGSSDASTLRGALHLPRLAGVVA